MPFIKHPILQRVEIQCIWYAIQVDFLEVLSFSAMRKTNIGDPIHDFRVDVLRTYVTHLLPQLMLHFVYLSLDVNMKLLVVVHGFFFGSTLFDKVGGVVVTHYGFSCDVCHS